MPPRDPAVLDLPFTGRWKVQNSPADRVPSHGTEAFGSAYAIDLVPVDERGRSARLGWRAVVATEAPERFVGFGRAVLAPVEGEVVGWHDGEPDHAARRSPLLLLGYALTQGSRARLGAPGLAGNHVVLRIGTAGPFVLLAHLRRGTVAVRTGERVRVGQPVGECGNSGNSTEPHLHLQVSDSDDWATAAGLPFAFRDHPGALPRNGEVVTG